MSRRRNPDSYISLYKVIKRVKQRAASIPITDLPFSTASWNNFIAKDTI